MNLYNVFAVFQEDGRKQWLSNASDESLDELTTALKFVFHTTGSEVEIVAEKYADTDDAYES